MIAQGRSSQPSQIGADMFTARWCIAGAGAGGAGEEGDVIILTTIRIAAGFATTPGAHMVLEAGIPSGRAIWLRRAQYRAHVAEIGGTRSAAAATATEVQHQEGLRRQLAFTDKDSAWRGEYVMTSGGSSANHRTPNNNTLP